MARMTVSIEDETRDNLIDLAQGERKIGAKINELVAAEVERRNAPTLESLEHQIGFLEHLIGMIAQQIECPACGGKTMDIDGNNIWCWECGILLRRMDIPADATIDARMSSGDPDNWIYDGPNDPRTAIRYKVDW